MGQSSQLSADGEMVRRLISRAGQRLFTAHTKFATAGRPDGEWMGPQVSICDIPSFTLMPGAYTMRVWLDINNHEADLIDQAATITVIGADYYGSGKMPWNGRVVLPHQWSWGQPVQSLVEDTVSMGRF